MILLSGSSNPELAEKIAIHEKIKLGKIEINQFRDGETQIEIKVPLSGEAVCILQSTSYPTNHHLMELLLIIDAAKRAQAKTIMAAIPYFGYARQDKRLNGAQVPISAKLVADLLTCVGVQRVLTVDLHNEQIQSFFNIPLKNSYTTTLFLNDIKTQGYVQPLVISPDMGGVTRASVLAKSLENAELAILNKRRLKPNLSQIMTMPENVKDRCCIIVDDIVDTAGTLYNAAETLKKQGAAKVVAYVTHPVLSNNALELIAASSLDELTVTDTIPLKETANSMTKIRQLSVAEMMAKWISDH
jgi:ribose-phosphate pyrophosphokinase